MMKPINRRTAIKLTAAGVGALALRPAASLAQEAPQPFGAEFPQLESLTTGDWWTKGTLAAAQNEKQKDKGKGDGQPQPPSMDVRSEERRVGKECA